MIWSQRASQELIEQDSNTGLSASGSVLSLPRLLSGAILVPAPVPCLNGCFYPPRNCASGGVASVEPLSGGVGG